MTLRARRRPAAVTIVVPAPPRSSAVIAVPSCSRTPSATARSRRPAASLPGWTAAAGCSSTPARWTREPVRSHSSACVSRRKTCSPPLRSTWSTVSSHAPTWAGVVAVQCRPVRAKSHGSSPLASSAPISSSAASAARTSRSASVAPQSSVSSASWRHQPCAWPPLRPEAPAPQQVALEHDDVGAGIALLEPDRRPQADVAAADDRDVGVGGAPQRRGRRRDRRLLPPQDGHRSSP